MTIEIEVEVVPVQPSVEIVVEQTGARGPMGPAGASAYDLAVTEGGFEGTLEQWQAEQAGADGEDGAPGEAPELRVDAGQIQWKLPSAEVWTSIIAVEDLKGGKGDDGDDGESPELRVDSGFVQWKLPSSEVWTNLIATATLKGDPGNDGEDGDDGREVQIQSDGTHIQWRYVGEVAWTNIVALATLAGTDGEDGNDGDPGVAGNSVRSGSGAPAGALGVDGDFYIDTTAWTIYGPKASGAWGSPSSLVGPAGDGASDSSIAALIEDEASATRIALDGLFEGGGGGDLAIAPGSAMNPHTTQDAARNPALPVNFWKYTGTAGVNNPTHAIDGDEWINA